LKCKGYDLNNTAQFSNAIFALSKNIPRLNECASVLGEARRKDAWDYVAQLMTQDKCFAVGWIEQVFINSRVSIYAPSFDGAYIL